MFYQTEAKPQSWRRPWPCSTTAPSSFSISTARPCGFAKAFARPSSICSTTSERATCITSRCNAGRAPDSGRWQHQSNLAVPTSMPAPMIVPMMIEEEEEEMAQVA